MFRRLKSNINVSATRALKALKPVSWRKANAGSSGSLDMARYRDSMRSRISGVSFGEILHKFVLVQQLSFQFRNGDHTPFARGQVWRAQDSNIVPCLCQT